jgi:hypothetical protein
MSERGRDAEPEHTTNLGERQSVLVERSVHRDNSRSKAPGTGFARPAGEDGWESHHIVCLSAMGKRKPASGQENYMEACLWMTKWNINDPPNMIGLPTRRWYMSEYHAGRFEPKNLPSHKNDHDLYLEEVTTWLQNNVWSRLNPKEKNHRIGGEPLQRELETASRLHERLLLIRGKRNGGTEKSWLSRMDNNKDKAARHAAGGANNLWYQPFSMARVPRPRSPGISLRRLGEFMFKRAFWK